MKITKVGPGLISIPPPDWGAVEMLIFDQASKLLELGHEITIVNEKEPNKIISLIDNSKPEIIHFHYDQHINLLDLKRFKNAYFTSHFPYTAQYKKYSKIFKNKFIFFILSILCKIIPDKILFYFGFNNVFLCLIRHFPLFIKFVKVKQPISIICLSKEIYDTYLHFGCTKRLLIHQNSAREDLIKFNKIPNNKGKAICIGLIQPRKKQAELQDIKDLYFVGPVADNRFKKNNKRYLGKWSRQDLYNNLSSFSTLVLLSEGEAHALVISEALIAGLGLVISEEAKANLNTNLEFIDIVPNKFLNNLKYIEDVINKNIRNSKFLRNDIREYGINYFAMSKIIKKYPPIQSL